MILLYSFLTGLILGVIFAVFKLPIPAPNNLAGVLGIVGIFVGYIIIKTFLK